MRHDHQRGPALDPAGLGASGEDPQWILAGCSLTFGVLLIPAGRAGDLFGHGRVFVLGVTLFEVVLALLYTGTINVYIIQTMFIQQGLGGGPCRKDVSGSP